MHAKTEAEIGHVVFEGVGGSGDFAFDAAGSEAAWNYEAVYGSQVFWCIFFGGKPDKVKVDRIPSCGGLEGFGDAHVSVVVADVFGDEADTDGFGVGFVAAAGKFAPARHIWL